VIIVQADGEAPVGQDFLDAAFEAEQLFLGQDQAA
jgi:hypothetical protein